MIILLYGEDTYRLNKKLSEIVGEYKAQKKGLNFKVIDAETDSFEEFLGELCQNSIFAEKIRNCENVFTNKIFKEQMMKDQKNCRRKIT